MSLEEERIVCLSEGDGMEMKGGEGDSGSGRRGGSGGGGGGG